MLGDAQARVSAGEPVGGALDLNHYFREQRAWYVSPTLLRQSV